jgi:uncharacterized protein (TIGR03437 family)
MRIPRAISSCAIVLALTALPLIAQQTYVITTVAGNGTLGYSGDGGPATSAEFDNPQSVAVDSGGNLFIGDIWNNRIRKVTPAGTISTVAGNGTLGYSGDGGPATSAELQYPQSVAVDSGGNLFIADLYNYRIRKVTPAGTISTVAGNGTAGFSGDGGPATSAALSFPKSVAVDGAGNLFVADQFNNRVRKVTPAGTISTVAGNGTAGFSGDGGPAISAELNNPTGVAVDGAGNLFIADYYNNRVRKVTPAGIISSVAGSGTAGFSGDGGPATSAELYDPLGVAVDGTGNLFIADFWNSRIREVTLAGTISTVAGNGTAGFSGDGGPATSAELRYPSDVAVDGAGNLFIADENNNRIRKLTPPGPTIGAGGVVNAASYAPGAVAPGSIAAAYGSFLISSSAAAPATPWPTTLGGISMQFSGGVQAPLYYVSGGQVNLQVPWEVAGQSQTTPTPTANGQTGAPQTVNISPIVPGIFATNGQGTGQGAIIDNYTYKLIDSSSPAVAGSTYVQIFCTGLGPVTNQPKTGSAAPTSTPYSLTTTTPTVTIGGVSAYVPFSGLAPGFVGLYQVDALVPANVAPGNAAPVVIYIGGATSNTVTMAVASSGASGALQIQITGLPTGTAASVSVTSSGFNQTITASQTLQAPPGVYNIVANPVAVGTVTYYAQAPPPATVSSGSSTTVQVAYATVVPSTTKTPASSGLQGLTVSADGSAITLPASSSVAQSFAPGSVLAFGVTPSTPYGLLRKVVSVSATGSQITAQTTQATLLDAFQQADFAFSTTFDSQSQPALRPLRPGVTVSRGTVQNHLLQRTFPRDSLQISCSSDTSLIVHMFDTPIVQDGNGTITAEGEIQLCPRFDFNWSIRPWPPALKSLTATATFGEDIHVNLTGSYKSAFNKTVPIATLASEPITVFVGPVPVVLTPVITFFVGASGQLNAGFSAGVTQAASVTGGISYANGQASPVFTKTASFGEDPLGLDANVSAKADAGVTIALNVDGVLSPEFSPDAYVQMDANLFSNPWWTLSAGLEGDASVKVGIFGLSKDFDFPTLFDFSKVIAQASGGFTGSSAAPVLSLVSPSSAPAGSQGLTLTLTGVNFVPGATVRFNGGSIATAYVSPTQLTASLPASALTTAGTFSVVVSNPDQTGAASQPLSFVVQPSTSPNPVPSISYLSPTSATAGSAGPLPVAINGTGFLKTSTATFNGIAHAATFVSANQLTISLSTTDLGAAGTFQVVVTNPAPGGGNSQPVAFTVQPATVTPTLQSLALSEASVIGGGFVTGTITLSAAAPSGGVQVQVSSNNANAQAPPFVNVSGGQNTAIFTITTTMVTSSQTITISAILGGVTKTANLTVNAATATATAIYEGTDSGIYKSADGGVTWQQSLAIQPLDGFVWAILVDPAHHTNVYALASDYQAYQYNAVVYRSTDSGQSWVKATVLANSMVGPSTLAIDAVATNVLYVDMGGIYRSTDSGATWQPTPLARMFSITADPVVSGVVYATDSIHIYKSSDFGETWSLLATFFNFTDTQIVSYVQFPSVSAITVDPRNSSTLYAASAGGWCWNGTSESQCGGIFRSTDGGKTWQDIGVAGSYSNISIDNSTGAIYAGGSLQPFFGYVIKSGDGGKTWTAINNGLTTSTMNVFIDPGNSSNLYGVGSASTANLNGIFRSTNGGGNWTFTPLVISSGQLLSFGIPAK